MKCNPVAMNQLTKSVGMRVVGTIETNVEVTNYVDRVRVVDDGIGSEIPPLNPARVLGERCIREVRGGAPTQTQVYFELAKRVSWQLFICVRTKMSQLKR